MIHSDISSTHQTSHVPVRAGPDWWYFRSRGSPASGPGSGIPADYPAPAPANLTRHIGRFPGQMRLIGR